MGCLPTSETIYVHTRSFSSVFMNYKNSDHMKILVLVFVFGRGLSWFPLNCVNKSGVLAFRNFFIT